MNSIPNRSMAPGIIIPELAYPDVRAAADWLCEAFGFQKRLVIGDHRVQLIYRGAALIVTKGSPDGTQNAGHAIMVSVDDVDRHCENARQRGAQILQPPTDFPFGERQYSAEDPARHRWTFSQSIADIDPASWGGVLVGREDSH